MVAEVDGLTGDRVAHLVADEQVRLAIGQVRRIPVPHFFVDVCIATTGWYAGLGEMVWYWLAVMTTAQVGRTLWAVRAYAGATYSPERLLPRLAASLTILGGMHALFMVAMFTRPTSEAHYIFTMILVGNAAGAIAPAAGHLRSYVAWAIVFGGTLVLCWLFRHTMESVAVAILIVFLFTILTLYVRDQGRALVTQMRLAESLRIERDRAEAASQAKTRFFAAASHDLRQPLTALAYNAATVQALASIGGDETLSRVGSNIQRALAESRGLLDSLLEMSQLDANSVDVTLATVDVSALLEEICEAFAPVAGDRGLQLLVSESAGTHIFTTTDAGLLRRILQNLVGNALKFTTEGRVVLNARLDNQKTATALHVSVEDTGPGIPIELREHVFEEFFQVGNAERNRSRGLGLGLSIVRRLAVLLGAQVELDGEIGRGSIFDVILPCGWRGDGDTPALPASAESAIALGGVCVLLIDDERDIRDALQTLLATMRWEVAAVDSIEGAIAALDRGFVPDALIVDFRLQGGASGLDALSTLRAHGCVAPAWLVTGDTAPERIRAARAAGVPVIYKPVDGLELVHLVAAALVGR